MDILGVYASFRKMYLRRGCDVMFNGKLKAITFSYDDGITQDIRLVELFDKYGLKCTFNLNSELAGTEGRISANKIAEIYRNHEIAAHTLTHPSLINLDNDEIVRQIEQDRINLEKLVGYPVRGMAYPYASPQGRRFAGRGCCSRYDPDIVTRRCCRVARTSRRCC